MAGPADLSKKITMLTRTDFLIQFIWQPLKPEYQPKDDEERMNKRDAIAKLLTWLADPGAGDPTAEAALTSQIEQWKRNPFMPHLIARLLALLGRLAKPLSSSRGVSKDLVQAYFWYSLVAATLTEAEKRRSWNAADELNELAK